MLRKHFGYSFLRTPILCIGFSIFFINMIKEIQFLVQFLNIVIKIKARCIVETDMWVKGICITPENVTF